MAGNSSQSQVARCFASVVDHPRICLLILIALSSLAIGGYYRPTWASELWRSFRPEVPAKPLENSNRPSTSSSQRVERDSLGYAPAYLVIDSDHIFTREGAAAIRDIVTALESLDTVDSVRWLDHAPPLNIFGLSEPLLPKGQASPQRFEAAKQKALRHPLVLGSYLSSDAKTLLLGIAFNWVYVDDDADCTTELIEAAKETLAKHPGVTMHFSVTGHVPLRLAILKLHSENEFLFRIFGYSICLLMAVILFRGITAVVIVAAAPALGVFWSVGFLYYFGWDSNPFSQVVLPVLLSLVGFADGVHMIVFIRQCLREGHTPHESCRMALATVGVACSVTTITTSIGMGSLAFSRNEVVREFAYACVLGSVTILVAMLLVISLACRSRWGARLALGANRGIIDQYLSHISEPVMAVAKHSRGTSYFAIGLLAVLTAVTFTLRPDDRQSNALPSGSDAQAALAHLDDALGGLEVGYVRLNWPATNLAPSEIAAVIHEIDLVLDQEPLLSHSLSLCRVLAALPGDASPIDKMPLAELLPPPLKLALYDPDQNRAVITFRVKDLGTATYEPVFTRIEQKIQQIQANHPGVNFELDGGPIWRWRNLYRIVSDLALSLGTASIEILLVMALVFRSIRLGLIAIIPNMIPLATSGTFMALFGWPLDIVSVCSFTICLGIAVDDTIHFLSRYREELEHQPDRTLAIQQAFQGVGTGMIMTTLVLIAGFCSVLLSHTRDHRVFGMLGIITLVSALLCDLFLLPSLLKHFDRVGPPPQ